jgi:hypothetical protein
LKTSQRCFIEGYQTFSETFPRSGTMRSGTVFQLPPLVRLTDATGSGLLPTPGAWDDRLPNPKIHEAIARHAAKGVNKQMGLRDAVMWPTSTQDGNYNRKGASEKSGDGLATAVGGSLNPTWVEWLMGFPLGFTDLER